MRKPKLSKSVKKKAPSPVKRAAPKKKKIAVKIRKNPVRKLTRYAVRVEGPNGGIGYFAGWDNKKGPWFDTDIERAVKGGDKKLMDHFANAIAEKKPRGVASVEVVIIGSPVKKN